MIGGRGVVAPHTTRVKQTEKYYCVDGIVIGCGEVVMEEMTTLSNGSKNLVECHDGYGNREKGALQRLMSSSTSQLHLSKRISITVFRISPFTTHAALRLSSVPNAYHIPMATLSLSTRSTAKFSRRMPQLSRLMK